MNLEKFSSSYKNWCKNNEYLFQAKNSRCLNASSDFIAVLPMNEITKMLLQQGVEMLNALSPTVELLCSEMNKIASMLPEYPVVMSIYGVGATLGSQLIAEIGDISRFEKKRFTHSICRS